jgi:hypothetical protein
MVAIITRVKKLAGKMAFRPFIALSAMHLAIENFFSATIWKIKTGRQKRRPVLL